MTGPFSQLLSLVVASSLLVAGDAVGQLTVGTSEPVGVAATPLLASSDTRVSLPFTRPPEFRGRIASVSGNTITLADAPGWSANQFQYAQGTQPKTYYAIIGPNLVKVTGTVIAKGGTLIVKGSGTAFTTQIMPGDRIVIGGITGTVASISSDTSLLLASVFKGATTVDANALYDHSPKEGSCYTVVANGSNTLTVNLNGDSLAPVASQPGNTTLMLIPYWTLGTVFPAKDAGDSFTVSTGSTGRTRGTQILPPDLTSSGINLAPLASYYFLNGHWRTAGGDPTVSYDDTLLPPTTYFIVRTNGTALATLRPAGSVNLNRLCIPLATLSTGQQDDAVAVSRPTDMTLNELGLILSGAFTASTSSKYRSDLLLTYDNTVPGVNKSAAAIYYYMAGVWCMVGGSDADYGNTVIPAGTGMTIRKAATANGATAFWLNDGNY